LALQISNLPLGLLLNCSQCNCYQKHAFC
jgi:hypothetical protein